MPRISLRSPARPERPVLLGRGPECERLESLIEAVRSGESRSVVLRGEAGVGKTALLDYLLEHAPGCRTVRVAAVESETELAFAALQLLCRPMLDRLDHLPEPQRDALATAFGLRAGPAPDRFLVGLAVLSLLADAASDQPLVCVVDDAQWLDRASAQALAVAARRLSAESVALVFAVRAPAGETELGGLQELAVGGLGEADARTLLSSVFPAMLDEHVRDRIVAETRGNPLAIIELPRELTFKEFASGLVLGPGGGLATEIENSFARRFSQLPPDTRRLLLIASAESLGDVVLVMRAAERLGISLEAMAPATAAGLIDAGPRLRFRHPLARSAVYGEASAEDRRAVHRALAEAIDPDPASDRRAWHQAQAAERPDEQLAAQLERSADLAQARGGYAQAGVFLERAAAITPDPRRRAQRALAAARAQYLAGDFAGAVASAVAACAGPLDEVGLADADLLRAQVAFAVGRSGEAPPLLLHAAKQLEPLNVSLARDTYLEAVAAAQFAGRLAGADDVFAVARAALAAPAADRPRATDYLLDGLATLIAEGYEAGTPLAKRALTEFSRQDLPQEEAIRWLWLASRVAIEVWDFERWDLLSTRLVALARESGAVVALPLALTLRTGVDLLAGELAVVAGMQEEVEAINQATGSHLAPYARVLLLAWQGAEEEATALIDSTLREVRSRGEGQGLAVAYEANAVLLNGLGRYHDAVRAARLGSSYPEDMAFRNWSLAELVEAATRTGDLATASDALEELSKTTGPSGTDWARGTEVLGRALLTDGDAAEELYRQAITHLESGRVRATLARAHLLYGEWLRRNRHNLAARSQLRTAHQMLTAMGMNAFAERAARELRAAGATVRNRAAETTGNLTSQETQIARLASEGLSNPEIATRLFLSPRTVEYHLGKVFAKLGIKTRKELARAARLAAS
jgi:DNA-binding CsgD family transcriptional regulator